LLVVSCWLLVFGFWLFVVVCLLFVVGCWLLVVSCEALSLPVCHPEERGISISSSTKSSDESNHKDLSLRGTKQSHYDKRLVKFSKCGCFVTRNDTKCGELEFGILNIGI